MRRSGVNGTAKVYFAEEKEGGLLATRPWGPIVGMSACQGARETKETEGRREGGEGGRVYGETREEEEKGGRWW